MDRTKKIGTHKYACSFCGEKLECVCGPAVNICEQCARLCISIFEQHRAPKPEEQYDGA